MIIINASNIAALEKTGAGNRARVDGGGGMDALKLEGAGLALMIIISSPKPALNTSIPPLPVRMSLPAPQYS
jgi:hypothetical protein